MYIEYHILLIDILIWSGEIKYEKAIWNFQHNFIVDLSELLCQKCRKQVAGAV